MSDLTAFRDHCRRMAAPANQSTIHLTTEQRAMFAALAREVDVYLDRPDADEPLDLDGAAG